MFKINNKWLKATDIIKIQCYSFLRGVLAPHCPLHSTISRIPMYPLYDDSIVVTCHYHTYIILLMKHLFQMKHTIS